MKKFDETFLSEDVKKIVGVDEAGRGPLAGPVVSAAVMFDRETEIPKVNDSKVLSEKIREELYDEILNKAVSVGVGVVSNIIVDKINILQATLLSMQKAVAEINVIPDLILIDGNKAFTTSIDVKTIVKGDSKSFSIAAASIIAKVTRDRIMKIEALKYPEYNWHKNKGYATKEHITAIQLNGITKLHRKSFLSRIINPDNQETLFR